MGKNKENKQNTGNFTGDIKTKGGEVIKGLEFDVQNDVNKQLDEKHKETPSTRVLEELVEDKIQEIRKILENKLTKPNNPGI